MKKRIPPLLFAIGLLVMALVTQIGAFTDLDGALAGLEDGEWEYNSEGDPKGCDCTSNKHECTCRTDADTIFDGGV